MSKLATGELFCLIHDYLKLYLPKQRKLSPHTVRSYREALELLVDYVKEQNCVPLGDVSFEMLNSDMINGYLDYLEAERGCSIGTRNTRLAAIRAFLKFAADRDVTTIVQFNELKKVPVKKPDQINIVDYMSMAAITAIIAQTDATTAKGLRDRFFMILLYDTGARIQEILGVKLQDLRMSKTATITLHGKGGKIRSVPLMEKTVLHLHEYLAAFHPNTPLSSDAPLFYSVIHGIANSLSDRGIRKMLEHYGEKAREVCDEVPENVHPHLWRHSRAMHLYQHGMDLTLVSQWLGHAHLETTLVYAHADTEQKRKAIAAATPTDNPLSKKLNASRFTITDEETLKQLAGLR